LLNEFFHCECVSQRASRIRAAVGNEIRFHSLFGSAIECLLQNFVPIFALGHRHDFRAKQFIEQPVCGWLFWLFTR
jgi:hypothetical protein